MDFIPYKINEALENVFIQIHVELFDNELYSNLNSDSILLYGLLLSRLSLSLKNKWADKDGNIFLIYSRKGSHFTGYMFIIYISLKYYLLKINIKNYLQSITNRNEKTI